MKLLSPLIYAISVLPAAFLVFLGIRIADFYLRLPEPIGVAVPIMLVGGSVFGCLGWVLLRLEGLRQPKIVDHVRHCAILYALLVLALVGALWVFSSGLTPGPGAAVVFVVFVSAACAVSSDAVVLLWQRRRFDHATSGGAS